MKPVFKLSEGLLTPSFLGGIGFFLGFYFIVFYNSKSFADSVGHLNREPEVTVWSLLIAGQVGLWFGYAVPIAKKIYEYWKSVRIFSWELLFTFLIIAVLSALFLYSHQKTSISGLANFPIDAHAVHGQKINVLNYLGMFVIVSALFGGYVVGQAFKQLAALASTDSGNDSVRKFLKYKEDLQWFLTAAGLMVGGATLTTGALHRALSVLNAYKPNSMLILLYGAYISGVVALIFIPAIIKSHAAGSALRERLLPFPEKEIDGEGWIKWSDTRSKLDAVLGLNKDLYDNLKVGLAILTPIVSSAVSLFIGKS